MKKDIQLQSYKDFKKQNYENERIEEIISYICNNDTELQKLVKKSEKLYNELNNSINKNQQILLSKFIDIQDTILSYENYYIAKKVYNDLMQ